MAENNMSLAERWLRHPHGVWLRRALFQVHLWTGLILALYVLVMSLTGTVLIYRRELAKAFSTQPHIVAGPGPRMTADELKQAAEQAHPGYYANRVFEPRNPSQPVEIWLERGPKRIQHLFNPHTGADLGNSLQAGFRAVLWLVDLHDNLLSGRAGHLANGVGGVCVTLVCLSGIIIWWPGIDKWRRSLTIDWRANPRSFNWSLHSALGFWSLAFIFMWGISGIYLSWPAPFNGLVDFFDTTQSRDPRFGDQVLAWLARLHFGRFPSLSLKLVWTFFGLVPVALLITGVLMWWNRVLGPWYRRRLAESGRLHVPRIPQTRDSAAVYNSRSTSC
jgi:uncharacterized iron-regulated membrane protein